MAVPSPERRVVIEDKIRTDLQLVRDEYGHIRIPVPLEVIARKYGLEIMEVDFPEPEISGMLKRDMGVIAINRNDGYRRQVFTIAHELGHAALHDKDEVYRMDAQKVEVNDPEETEANWYAARILMPEEELKRYWNMYPSDLKTLSDIFGVSQVTMSYRLGHLGLLPNS